MSIPPNPAASDRIYPNEFYGDNTRWFVGVVEDINDPARLGRVRVRVRGVHSQRTEDIDVTDLPWASVVIPTTEGGVSGLGRNAQLQRGAEVFGLFLDGQASQLPMILGSIPRMEYSSPTQNESPSGDPRTRPSRPSSPGGAPAPSGGGSTSPGDADLVPPGASSTGPGTGSSGDRNLPQPATPEGLGVIGNSNAERAFNYFIEYGFTPQQAAGIVGNLMQESGPSLDTSIEAAGSEQSYGIAQWNAATDRFDNLRSFASDLGRPWTDLSVQLRFITHELETNSGYGMAELRASTTIEQAMLAFQDRFERCGTCHTSSRLRYARDIYSRMVTS